MITTNRRDVAVAKSEAMRTLVDMAKRFAKCSAPVLITGESGTGKEVVSRTIHEHSDRATVSYVRVNCAALSESLFESELFGHEAGSFTGATSQRIGRFEVASGGTLLLDEISEIPLRLQAKLLRVLEEGEFERVGGNQSRQTDVRILATSNRDLRNAVATGEFREDLYYRLSVLNLQIAPLRERREDIQPLVQYFLERFANEGLSNKIVDVDARAMDFLRNYDWPGNVRQLRNVVHQMCVLSPQATIRISDIPPLLDTPKKTDSLYDIPLKDSERIIIENCIKRYHGNKTAAARHLGVTARTLHNKIRQYTDAA